MKIRVLLVILSVFVSGVIYAQTEPTVNVLIKGQVVDSLTIADLIKQTYFKGEDLQ